VTSEPADQYSFPASPTIAFARNLFVANIKSQIKRNLQNEKRRERNKGVRSELKTRVKNAIATAETGGEEATAAARLAAKRIDKAAAKGVIHKNAAARRKSRLQKTLNKAAAKT
jgi:small subunit ribosomal protein S20